MGRKYNSNQLNGAAEAGRVQELDPLGNIVWDYIYSNSDHLSHHDLTLVGDNVLTDSLGSESLFAEDKRCRRL